MTELPDPPISQGEYIALEATYLRDCLAAGDQRNAAVSAATLRNEMHHVYLIFQAAGVDLDDVSGRITTHNGRYYARPFLTEGATP